MTSTQTEDKNTEIQLVVAPGQKEHVRLDKYITLFVQNATRNKVQSAIKDGYVLVNGKVEKPSYKVLADDVIDITLPKPPPPEAVPEDIPLNIIYEDDDLLIVNKKAGMVVHPAFGNWTGTMVNGLLYHISDLPENEDEEDIRPGIVHRIDKDTSGLLVVAKKEVVLSELSQLFAKHDIERTYWAIVWGTPDEEGTITGNIGRSKKDRKKMTVVEDSRGKPAVTHYKVIEYFDYLSLVEVRLETGRTHQIRVHFSEIGHPVFGDPTYGGRAVRYGSNTGHRKKMFDNLFKKLDRQCLHAKTLGFKHPAIGEFIEFDSKLPGDFQNVLNKLRQFCKP
ncbi:MAG TPA: RluA family pseudouridine synthase [Balneolales bacterium]|nr:RluA family pseudouridine synthase [Balneolales bacterium]